MGAPNHGDRISSLEEGYKSLGREIGGMRDDFATFARDMRNETNAIRQDSANRSRTQWGPIISALSVVVAILGGLVTLGAQGPLRDLNRHDEVLVKMSENRFTEHDGDELRAQLDRDNETLRHEMELVVAPLLVRLEYIEKGSEDDIAEIREEILRMRIHFQAHIEKEGHPALTEALRGLEKRIDTIDSEQRRRASRVYDTK